MLDPLELLIRCLLDHRCAPYRVTPQGLTYLVPAVAPRAWGRTVARAVPASVPCSFICVTRELLAAVFATRCAIRGTRVGVGSKTRTWPWTAT